MLCAWTIAKICSKGGRRTKHYSLSRMANLNLITSPAPMFWSDRPDLSLFLFAICLIAGLAMFVEKSKIVHIALICWYQRFFVSDFLVLWWNGIVGMVLCQICIVLLEQLLSTCNFGIFLDRLQWKTRLVCCSLSVSVQEYCFWYSIINFIFISFIYSYRML